jgi:hypothetical protein
MSEGLSRERSENPLRRAFWLGSIDPRPFALFRIAFGLALVHDLVDYSQNVRAFLTDVGMLPRGAIHDWSTWGIFDLVGTVPAVAIVYALGCCAVVAFTIGFHTRIATIVSWAFLLSIHHRNYYVTDGGDDLARILLFYAMFANLGAAYSVDAWRARVTIRNVPAFVPRILQLHIAFLYFVAARLKLHHGWLHTDVILMSLQLDGYARPLGRILGGYPLLCRIATRSILAMEFLFPFFAFSPVWRKPSRAIAIALGLVVQGGIFLTLRVGIFTEVMFAVELMWLQPAWIDSAEAWIVRRFAIARRGEPMKTMRAPSWVIGVYCLLAAQFVVAQWDPFAGRRFPLPAWLRTERAALDVVQPAGLFHIVYSIRRWTAMGRLEDGTEVDVLAVSAPLTQPRKPGYSSSRWNKLTFKEMEHPFLFSELGAYLCRTYDERSGHSSKLASFVLLEDMYPARGEHDGPQSPKHRELVRFACARDLLKLGAN